MSARAIELRIEMLERVVSNMIDPQAIVGMKAEIDKLKKFLNNQSH